MFPAVDEPSNADLAAKLVAEGARTDEAISTAQSTADTARIVALAAVIVAVVAIGLAITAPQGSEDAGRTVSTPLAHAAGADETLSLILLFAGIWVGVDRLVPAARQGVRSHAPVGRLGVDLRRRRAGGRRGHGPTHGAEANPGADVDRAATGLDRDAALPRAGTRVHRIGRRTHRAHGVDRCDDHVRDIDDRLLGHRAPASEPGRHARIDDGRNRSGGRSARRRPRARTR